MAQVRCVDGSVLTVLPVPVLDRDGVPYEATLRLLRDGAPFGEVGERCAFFLTSVADRVRTAEAFPPGTLEDGVRAAAREAGLDGDELWRGLERHLPRDRELLALLSRDPDDLASAGELRLWLRTERTWVAAEPRGHWERRDSAVLDAWGAGGTGVRALLDRPALLELLDQLTSELARVLGAD